MTTDFDPKDVELVKRFLDMKLSKEKNVENVENATSSKESASEASEDATKKEAVVAKKSNFFSSSSSEDENGHTSKPIPKSKQKNYFSSESSSEDEDKEQPINFKNATSPKPENSNSTKKVIPHFSDEETNSSSSSRTSCVSSLPSLKGKKMPAIKNTEKSGSTVISDEPSTTTATPTDQICNDENDTKFDNNAIEQDSTETNENSKTDNPPIPDVKLLDRYGIALFQKENDSTTSESSFAPYHSFGQMRTHYPKLLIDILTENLKFDKPSQIQAHVWPAALKFENIIGVAQTGSGKTFAFLLPCIISLEQSRSKYEALQKLQNPQNPSENSTVRNTRFDYFRPSCGLGALILAPTRELAYQIHSDADKYFAKKCDLKFVASYGRGKGNGKEDRNQQAAMFKSENVAAVVGCPGRVKDLIESRDLRVSKNCMFFVLDECDRMLDMGFISDIKRIASFLPTKRQNFLFSATFSDSVKELALNDIMPEDNFRFDSTANVEDEGIKADNSSNIQNDTSTSGNSQKLPLIQIRIGENMTGNTDIQQKVFICNNKSEKFRRLSKILFSKEHFDKKTTSFKPNRKFIVFTRTKADCSDIAFELGSVRFGNSNEIKILNGDVSQSVRERTYGDFRNGT